jgi:suppressor for copper-sensitivity B
LDDLEVLVDAGSRSFETGPLRAITASPVAANSDSTSLWLALLFALIGGFILNFMPCVLPVVMIKTHSLLVAASDHSAKGVSFKANLLATSLGVISSFLALGILTGSLREAGHQVGWGFQFQIPSFLIFMILVLFLFALNLFGLFEFQLPHGLTQRLGGRSGEKTHSFLEGVFATILATPCSAPFLGTALTFGLTQGWLALIGIFVSMGVGLALPYLILLVRPQWIRLLPRPGAWMGGLKRWMAYLLLLTALWLAYVLQQQVSSLLLILLLFGLGAIFISLRELRSSLRWAFVLLVSLGLILVSRSPQINASSPQTETTKFVFSPEAVDQKLREGKTLFLYITADWCLTCKFNEAAVIEHPEFVRKLREKSIEVVRVDWTKRDPLVGQYLESFNRVGIPFAVLLRGSDREVFPELMVLQDSLKRVDEFF